MMNLSNVPVGVNPPVDVNAIVEVPIGGEPIKYELDKATGLMRVDRFLYTAMRYPGNYGFIPNTLSADGDPCDVLVANTRAIIPGALMSVRPVGVLVMEDDAGKDEKIIAVPSRHLTRRYDTVESYRDLPAISIEQIEHFFAHYKDLEPGKWVRIDHWGDRDEAHRLIREAIERAKPAGRGGAMPVARCYFAVTAITSISTSMSGQASWLTFRRVEAGTSALKPAISSLRHLPHSAKWRMSVM